MLIDELIDVFSYLVDFLATYVKAYSGSEGNEGVSAFAATQGQAGRDSQTNT